jgi:hypothetical protein
LIGGALLLTLGAMYMLDESEDKNTADVAVTEPSKPRVVAIKSKNLMATNSSSDVSSESLPDLSHKTIFAGDAAKGDAAKNVSKDAAKKETDLFQPHAWYIPPPPPKVVVPEVVKPIPHAPPVPFIYMGKLENTPQGTLVFLSARNKVLSVIAGKNVDPMWRLDKEDANALYFTYIPLSLPKVLSKMARASAANTTAVADNAAEVTDDNQIQDH